MKKVYQTVVDKDKGNCMQATIASILELPLDDVPNFIEFDKKPGTSSQSELIRYLSTKGYDYCYINRGRHDSTEFLRKVAKFDGGVNGFFYASVPSQSFEGCGHAVVIDTDLNIVHDPNPNQLALNLTPDDVEGFIVVTEFIIGKTGKLFRQEEWDNATEEERDANIYKSQLGY